MYELVFDVKFPYKMRVKAHRVQRKVAGVPNHGRVTREVERRPGRWAS